MPSRWHHAPLHVLFERGIYMVTAGTYEKAHLFASPMKLNDLHDSLHRIAGEYGWELRAWAILSNHYHFIASSSDDPRTLTRVISKLHTLTATSVNREDAAPGRKVWHQYWETRITFETSYLARLNYVHQNPVHHHVVTNATAYPWCSAARFEALAEPSFQRTVSGFPTDRLNVPDDF